MKDDCGVFETGFEGFVQFADVVSKCLGSKEDRSRRNRLSLSNKAYCSSNYYFAKKTTDNTETLGRAQQ